MSAGQGHPLRAGEQSCDLEEGQGPERATASRSLWTGKTAPQPEATTRTLPGDPAR